jgi:hypothetical protein
MQDEVVSVLKTCLTGGDVSLVTQNSSCWISKRSFLLVGMIPLLPDKLPCVSDDNLQTLVFMELNGEPE